MEREKPHERTIEKIRKDFRWGDIAELISKAIKTKRQSAIIEVLSNIPKVEYEKLEKQLGRYNFFIPEKNSFGKIEEIKASFNLGIAMVIYLDPLLEDLDPDRVKVVVAHEFAHIILEHKSECWNDEYWEQERKAWEEVSKWGFSKEVENHLVLRKRGEKITIRFEPFDPYVKGGNP